MADMTSKFIDGSRDVVCHSLDYSSYTIGSQSMLLHFNALYSLDELSLSINSSDFLYELRRVESSVK